MNTLFEKYKWLKYAIGAFIIALGILIIILASIGTNTLQEVITIVLASASMLIGIVLIVVALLSESHKGFTLTLVIGSAAITAGIVLLIDVFALHHYFDNKLLVYLISIFTLVFGVASIIKGISLIVFKEKRSLIVLLFGVGTLALVGGILGIVFCPDLVKAAYIVLGVLILVAGILLIIFSAIGTKKRD